MTERLDINLNKDLKYRGLQELSGKPFEIEELLKEIKTAFETKGHIGG